MAQNWWDSSPLAEGDKWWASSPLASEKKQPEGAFNRAARIAADPDGGLLPAAGSLIASALPEGGEKRTGGGYFKDTAVDAVRGVVGLGQSVIGLGNLVSFGALGKGMEALGYSGEQTQQFLGGLYTADRQQADKNVDDAKGFFNTLGALAVNPSALMGSVVQAIPQTVAAGAVGGAMVRALLPGATKAAQAAGLVGDDATKFISNYVAKRATVAAGVSEGGLTAGSIAESGREAKQDFTTYAPAALVGGAVTGIIGAASGAIGRRVGLGDIEADIAMRSAGVTPTTAAAAGSRLKTIGKEALKEGVLEEAPQSFQEALATQYAQGKPFDFEEAASQAAQGLATGGVMGGFNAAVRGRGPQDAQAATAPAAGSATDAQLNQSLDALQRARDEVYLGGQSGAETVASVVSAPTPNGDIGPAIEAAMAAAGPSVSEMMQDKRLAAAKAVADQLGIEPAASFPTAEQIIGGAPIPGLDVGPAGENTRPSVFEQSAGTPGLQPGETRVLTQPSVFAEPSAGTPGLQPGETRVLTQPSALEAPSAETDQARVATLRAGVDRDAQLLAQREGAGTQFEREQIDAQRQINRDKRLPSRQGAPAAGYADLAPMDERTARGRLKVLRDQAANEAGDALSLQVVPHPNTEGKFAISKAELPSLEMPAAAAPAPVTPQEAGQRLEAAAAKAPTDADAMIEALKVRDTGQAVGAQLLDMLSPGDQAAYSGVLRSVEQRGGKALPLEAALLDRVNPGAQNYDSLVSAPMGRDQLRTLQKLTESITALGDPQKQAKDAAGEQLRLNALVRQGERAQGIEQPLAGRAPESLVVENKSPTAGGVERAGRMDRRTGEQRSADAFAALDRDKALRQISANLANLFPQQRATEAPDVALIDKVLRKTGALRTADEKMVVDGARKVLTPAQFDILQRGALNPASLGAVERLQLRRMREGDFRFSEQRATSVATAAAEPEATQQGRAVSTRGNITTVDPATLPTNSKADSGTISKQTHRMVSLIGSMFGKRVVVFSSDNDMAPDGFVYRGDSKTIYLNRKSEISHLVVFGHELLHQLKADNPQAYAALMKVIKLKEGADTDVAGIRGDMEELTADVVGNRFRETEFWRDVFREILASGTDARVSQRSAMRLGASVVRAVDRMVKALKGMTGFDTDNLVENLAEVKSAVTKALASYAQEKRGEATELIRQEVAGQQAPAPAATGEVRTSEKSPGWSQAGSNLTRGQAEQRVARMRASIGWRGYEIRTTPSGPRLAIEVKEIPEPPVKASDKRGALAGAPANGGGPDPRLVAVAEQYARDNGIDLRRQAEYVGVDVDRARRIAAAYEAMPHAPQDPKVREAYANLIRQTRAQYDALVDAGYEFRFMDPAADPYGGNPWNAMRDLRANQRMAVFPTEAGFGSSELDVADNPLLADTGLMWPSGEAGGASKRVLANDLFRAVHDAFGHGLEGAGFRAQGEENAWQAHVRLFTGSAIGAITSETRGQNSWLNYGPYGLQNRNAKVEDTIFADQKTGLMPAWTWTEGRVGDMVDEGAVVASEKRQVNTPEFKRWFGESKVVDGRGRPLVVYHGTTKDFSAFDPERIGDNFGLDEDGFFFTDSTIRASGYADPGSEFAAAGMGMDRNAVPRAGANVMPVFLSIKNPLTLEAYTEAFYTNPQVEIDEQGISLTDYFDDNRKSVMEFVKQSGRDGVLFQHKGKTLAVALRPEQIKSAIGNSGAFDLNDPDIRKSEKRILLNIGLSTKEMRGGGMLTEDVVRSALAKLGLTVDSMPVHPSDTEPTAVPAIDRPLTQEEGDDLSARLNQEAIVQRMPDGSGVLFGPMADEWGPYNPAYFVMRDGRFAVEHEIQASAKRPRLDPEIAQILGDHVRNLLPEERVKLRRDTARKLVDTISSLPSANEMAAVAWAGRAKRGWYRASAAAIEHVFAGDGPRFAALLAAMSPQTSVEANLYNTLSTWRNWVQAGRPTDRATIIQIMGRSVQGSGTEDSVLDAWRSNSVRALTAEDPSSVVISGPKVNSFMLNLRGYVDEVTNDAWMANYALVDQKIFKGKLNAEGTDPGKTPGYLAMSARVREAAKALTRLTGDTWTPAEVQETVWSWAKTLYESASVNKSAREIVTNKEITDELIRSTPDFRTLFHTDVNERLLQDAGLGDRVASLRERGDLGDAVAQGPDAGGQAGPFAADAQGRYELRAAGRLDRLREQRAADDVAASEKRTDTPEFKRWFGDSKLVDENGEPLTLYHGTQADNIRVFKRSEDGALGPGIYLTESMEAAGGYAGEGGTVEMLYARMERPLIVYAGKDEAALQIARDDKFWKANFFTRAAARKWAQDQLEDWAGIQDPEFPQMLKDAGYDGVILKNPETGEIVEAMVPSANQVKSNLNDGEWSRSNPDIYASEKRTDTPEFKRWFGDSQAVVAVNAETGEPVVSSREPKKLVPQVMYHTTRNDFTEFEIGRITTNSGTFGNWDTSRAAVFVTPDLDASQAYGTQGGAFAAGANVMPLYIKAENPLDLTGGVSEDAEQKLLDAGMSQGFINNGLGNWTMFDGEDGRAVVDAIKRADYDSVIFNDQNPDTGESFEAWALFSPEQIKSAIGNSGAFDLNDPDITASEKRNIFGQKVLATWTAPTDSKLLGMDRDSVIYKLQDKQIDMKRVVDAIKSAAGSIGDKWNAYLQEELYHGRTAKQTKDFLEDELKPLVQGMQANRVSLQDLEEYLHNRHAQERNAQIAKINPAFPDGGSGIDTADARAYLAGLDPAKRRVYEALAKRVDAITKETRELLVRSGLETRETINEWESAYGSYVPLFRDDIDYGASGGQGTGQGFSVRGPASKRATGSKREVVDILANVAMQRERAIVRAEKTRVGAALYGLAIQNPNTDFWLAVDPNAIKQVTDTMAQLGRMGLNPLDVQSIIQEPKQPYIDPRTGLVTQRVNPALRGNDNVLAVRINGQDKYLFFNNNDPRAKRMVESLKNLDANQLGEIMGMSAKVSRYFASINTQYNPIFGAINLMRDTQGAAFNLTTTPIADRKAQVMAGIMPAVIGIYADLRSRRAGKGANPGAWAQLWEEFQNEGGQTGFRDMFKDSTDRAKSLQSEIDQISEGKLKQAGRGIFNWLSDYNETLENAVRLSAYKAGKDKGLSNQQAASIAKNLTVNFNRKGEIGIQAGALYAFFNASVQGTARLVETLKGPAGKKIMAGGLLLGAMQALALAAAGFKDDEPPDFIKERNLVIPLDWINNLGGPDLDGKYITIPMPLGLHIIPNTSRVLTEWALSGWKSPTKRVAQITGAFLEAFNPVGNAGWSVQTIAPTFADPLVALAENRDWTGKPIAKEDRSGTDPTPGYTRAKDTASWLSKELSYYLNLATGGTKYTQGLVSPTPDQIDYLIGQVTGGVGREALKIQQTVESSFTGEELPTNKVPILGRFYGDTKEQSAVASRFFDNITKINEHENEIKGRIKNREGGVDEYRRENPEAKLVGYANQVEREVSEMRRRKRELLARDASPESIKILEERIARRMKQLNDRVEALEAQ